MISEYPEAGKWCWTNDCIGYPLPPDLEPRTRVKVIEELMPHFVVENAAGRRWRLFLTQLDAGNTYWLDGEPCFETHPKAIHYLRHVLRELDHSKSELSDHEQTVNERRSRTRWYLERNGHDPDGPLPPGPAPRFTGSPRKVSTYSPRAPRQFRPETGEKPFRVNS